MKKRQSKKPTQRKAQEKGAREVRWDKMFDQLVKFKDKHQHCNVPTKWPRNIRLGRWVSHQRFLKKEKRLRRDRERRLKDIGFLFHVPDVVWDNMYNDLLAFKATYGHCNVPDRYPENPTLAGWVHTQRTQKKRGTLSRYRVRQLQAAGFVWRRHDTSWDLMYQDLAKFKKATGHCNVPWDWDENQQLGKWVAQQRKRRKYGLLSDERIRKLKKLGFNWDVHASKWEVMYTELKRFQKKYGHCRVPVNWDGNPRLGQWVLKQRRDLKNGHLPDERRQRLEKLGFIWDVREVLWEQMFGDLMAFKKKYRHCNVPKDYPQNSKLGSWVAKQRYDRKIGRLPKDRIKRLDKAGFVWSLRKRKK